MKQCGTAYGTLHIGTQEEIFRKATEMLLIEASKRSIAAIGLPGGTTPHQWYQWVIKNGALSASALDRICWLTSDERHVPQESDQSNFGNAARRFLDPIGVPETRRMPWPTQVDPYSASIVFNRRWNERFGEQRCFDLCFMGLGKDGRIASIYPESPFRGIEPKTNFGSVEVPGKGWWLTVTELGLRRCGHIVITVSGASKNEALRRVFESPFDTSKHPAHLLRESSENVTWLLDEEAAAGLDLK